jgi:methylated-DNA-[protein]-cysteine S-methyltransferase
MPGDWRADPRAARLTPFQRAVYELLCRGVPPGRVSSYGAVGEALIGTPSGAQAVGNALRSNPFAPEVPCHRVVKALAGGRRASLGGFCGHGPTSGHAKLADKASLLAGEGVRFDGRGELLQRAALLGAHDFDPAAVAAARAFLSAAGKPPQQQQQKQQQKQEARQPPATATTATASAGRKRQRGE